MKNLIQIKLIFPMIFFALVMFSCESNNDSTEETEIVDTTSFITLWRTDRPGGSENNQILIPGKGTNYNIKWEEAGNPQNNGNLTGTDATIVTFPYPGNYIVSISGGNPAFNQIQFSIPEGDNAKIMSIEQWGNIQWSSMEEAFNYCIHLESNATDSPDLSNVTSLRSMFEGTRFNGDLSNWDVSNVTDMSRMFQNAKQFNNDISSWNVSNVTNMREMFEIAKQFNQDLNNWDVSSVTDMYYMFYAATSFDQDLNNWDVSSVTNMDNMFANTWNFNGNVASWNVSNVTEMGGMFNEAWEFNQNLSNWDVTNVTSCFNFGYESSLESNNFPNFTNCFP
jgi:surface protein